MNSRRLFDSIFSLALGFSFLMFFPPISLHAQTGSLQQLIDDAAPGSTLTLPEGRWHDPITIMKPLKLRGAGADKTFLDITADGPAINLTNGSAASLEALTIRWKRATSHPNPEPPTAVLVRDSKLDLREVRVQASDNPVRCPAALLALFSSELNVESSRLEGFDFTVQYLNGAKGRIVDTVVLKPGHCGITAGPNSHVEILRCIVAQSEFHAIRCTGGTLLAAENLVIANKNRGFYLGNKSARGSIFDNIIRENGTGISGFGSSGVEIVHNLIDGSDYAGIDMRDTCQLRISNNLLLGNARGLALFSESGRNPNRIGTNAVANCKIEAENFPAAPPFVRAEIKEPASSSSTAPQVIPRWEDHGVRVPERLLPLLEAWRKINEGAK